MTLAMGAFSYESEDAFRRNMSRMATKKGRFRFRPSQHAPELFAFALIFTAATLLGGLLMSMPLAAAWGAGASPALAWWYAVLLPIGAMAAVLWFGVCARLVEAHEEWRERRRYARVRGWL